MKRASNKAIILFDGVCNLCNSSVQLVLKHDKKKLFSFAALQSDVARELLLHYPKEIIEKDSIILIKNRETYTESTAALLIVKEFTGLWKTLLIFWIIPKFIRDFLYRIIAKNRYKWFGKRAVCMIPDKSVMDRFLEFHTNTNS